MKNKITATALICVLLFALLFDTQIVFASGKEKISFSFEEGAGIAVSDSQNGIILKASNVEWEEGKLGKAVTFSEESATIEGETKQFYSALSKAKTVTVSCWIRMNEALTHNVIDITDMNGSTVLALKASQTEISLIVSSCEIDSLKNICFPVTLGEDWNYLSVTTDFAAKTAKINVNNTYFGSVNDIHYVSNFFNINDGPYWISMGGNGMSLDEIKIYPEAIDEKTIQEEMMKTSPSSQKTEPLVPFAVWDFDDFDVDSGTVYGGGKKKINGKLYGSAAICDEGIEGNGLSLNPTKLSWLDLGNTLGESLEGSKGITVSMWVQNKEIPDVGTMQLFNIYHSVRAAFQINVNKIGISFNSRSCSTDPYETISANVPQLRKEDTIYTLCRNCGYWYHVLCVADYENKVNKLFINGQLAAKTETANYALNEFTIEKEHLTVDCIGGDPDKKVSFCGLIDNVMIFDRALSDMEAAAVAMPPYTGILSAREKDQILLAELKEKMNGAVAFYIGSSNAITSEKVDKIDRENYDVKALLINGQTYIPMTPIQYYFDTDIEYSDDGSTAFKSKKGEVFVSPDKITVNGTEIENCRIEVIDGILYLPIRTIAGLFDLNVFWDERGLIILSQSSNRFVAAKDEKTIDRLVGFFTDDMYPEPERPHEQSRSVVLYFPPKSRFAVQTPTIVRLDNGDFLACMGWYSRGGGEAIDMPTENVFRSTDGGKTFYPYSTIRGAGTGTLKVINGDIYYFALGGKCAMAISKSTDGGKSWTEPTGPETGKLFDNIDGAAHAGMASVLVANGKVYRVVERDTWSTDMKVLMLSAPVDSDLLNEANWTISNIVSFEYQWLKDRMIAFQPGVLEGNAVLAPDGTVKCLIRCNSRPTANIAAIFDLSEDGKTLSMNPDTGIIDFPGGHTQFQVEFDEESGYYVSLVNPLVSENDQWCESRNILALSASKDLYHWHVVETILVDREIINREESMMKHGFQYVTFDFDGDDIVCFVREAADDDAMGYHDANYATVYRISDFRKNLKRWDEQEKQRLAAESK